MRLQQVLQADLCSGCGLCAAIMGASKARMELDARGYLRPALLGPVGEAEDRLIAAVCPGSTVELLPGEGGSSPEWGGMLSVHTGHAVDPELRHQASSGGALSALVQQLLDSGEARFVLQVAASPEVPWLNQVVRSGDAAAVRRASGSRYAPSAPLESVVRCLEEGEPFVVVGKPCDIAALRAYARHDERVDRLVVAMIAFMCGGVPSARGVELLVKRMGAEPSGVLSFRFRGEGWPGRAKALSRSGAEHSMSYNDAWGGILSKHVQLRCKICPDGVGMSADIVCADAWYGDESGYPRFDEQDGRSLVIGRTTKGLALIRAAESAGRLAVQPLDPTEIDRMQPYQLRRTRLVLSRLLAMRLTGRRAPRFGLARLARFAAKAGLMANLRSFLGTVRRSVQGRL
jgi:coenzyme F420 hydrogenase subunit beta